uniref:GDT1 family protein n=1 Tax=Romanomermis culicivorax TaxID=13658 RepID=A0A915KK83_ROMCU
MIFHSAAKDVLFILPFLLFCQSSSGSGGDVVQNLVTAHRKDNASSKLTINSDKQSIRHKPNFEHLLEDAQLNLGFWHALVASFSVIIVSELGDKTFFIAAILAMRHSRLAVFLGAAFALFFMTILSVFLGWITQIIPRSVTYYVSTALFAIFGLKMLKEGWQMSPSEGQEEFEEAQEEVRKREDQIAKIEAESLLTSVQITDTPKISSSNNNNTSTGPNFLKTRRSSATFRLILRFLGAIFLESFTLTFLAEWGDRSQLTTIVLASRENVVGVTLGGFIGHALCTGLAVIGGRFVAQKISVRTVTIIGGVVFILFALSALVFTPEETTL